jgi:hypothetical protein
MDEEIAMTFNATGVVGIEVDEMGIESKSRKSE